MNKDVKIVDFEEQYRVAFKDLNVEWISHYFEMEPSDFKALDYPQKYIIDPGGHIYMALLNGEAVGTCALLKLEDRDYDYELVKMSVRPKAQGHGIGRLLGQAVIDKAKSLGVDELYLETNDSLKPAIRLYEKLGFEHISDCSTPYARCNVQMVKKL